MNNKTQEPQSCVEGYVGVVVDPTHQRFAEVVKLGSVWLRSGTIEVVYSDGSSESLQDGLGLEADNLPQAKVMPKNTEQIGEFIETLSQNKGALLEIITSTPPDRIAYINLVNSGLDFA